MVVKFQASDSAHGKCLTCVSEVGRPEPSASFEARYCLTSAGDSHLILLLQRGTAADAVEGSSQVCASCGWAGPKLLLWFLTSTSPLPTCQPVWVLPEPAKLHFSIKTSQGLLPNLALAAIRVAVS